MVRKKGNPKQNEKSKSKREILLDYYEEAQFTQKAIIVAFDVSLFLLKTLFNNHTHTPFDPKPIEIE